MAPVWLTANWIFAYHVNLCRHCDDPPCAEACPEEAIGKREDGIVIMDYNLCTGCQACMEACPYDAIAFDEDKAVAQKCNLCHHRVDRGLIPACADNICPAHCICFGFSETKPFPRLRSGKVAPTGQLSMPKLGL